MANDLFDKSRQFFTDEENATRGKRILGIDPGISGGLAVIDSNHGVRMTTTPIIETDKKNYLDEVAIKNWILIQKPDSAVVEKVGAMPDQGVTSMFSFGTSWGLVRGILVGLGIPYFMVTPQSWKKDILSGYPKGSDELVAKNLFPMIDFRKTERCRIAHDGLIDAVLIAEYGRRKIK